VNDDPERAGAPGDDADDDLGAGPEAAGEGPGVGDVVVIPYATVREQLGCGAEAGLLMEDRRSAVRVWFPTMDRTFWLERGRLAVVPPGRLRLHPAVDRLHRAARHVGADLIEHHDQAAGVGHFHVFCGAQEVDALQALRRELGDDLVRIRVEPGNMRRLRLSLWIRS
jgi:hypothetical protein